MGKMTDPWRPRSQQAQPALQPAPASDAKEPIGARVFGWVVGVYVIFCLAGYAILVMTGSISWAFKGAVPVMIVFFAVAHLIDFADSRRRR
jgi:hypothetical protein